MSRRLEVLTAGPLSTVQDLGRTGFQHLGFAHSGAADTYAAEMGNRILDNDVHAAVIEVTLGGAAFWMHSRTTFAITGANAVPRLNDEPIELWRVYVAEAHSVVRLGETTRGVRTYFCVQGGIDTPMAYGSRSTDLLAAVGGHEGRALRTGDYLPIGAAASAVAGRQLGRALRPLSPHVILVRAVPGPQEAAFTRQSRDTFFSSLYRVSPRADRTGIFLDGPRLAHTDKADIYSEGVVTGSVQVPASGQPLILLAEQRGIGGYTKIATICGADLPKLGQARPGDFVLFMSTDHTTAQRAYVALRKMCAWMPRVAESDVDLFSPPLSLEDWLHRPEEIVATIRDDRAPFILSDVDALVRVLTHQEEHGAHDQRVRVRGHVLAPTAVVSSAQILASAGGTVLAVNECAHDLPIGAIVAAIWSPGAWTLLIVGHPMSHFCLRGPVGTHVQEGDVLGDGAFIVAPPV